MIRIGLIGTDSHHSVYLPQEVNHPYSAHHDEARFTKIWGEDREVTERKARHLSIQEVVASPEDALRDVDAVVVLSGTARSTTSSASSSSRPGCHCSSTSHWPNSLREACELVALARNRGIPLMSCSHFRFDPAFVNLPIQRSLRTGFVGGPRTGPFPEPRSDSPFYYAIHPVEIFHALLGPGIAQVETLRTEDLDNVSVQLLDGRRGMIALLNDKQY